MAMSVATSGGRGGGRRGRRGGKKPMSEINVTPMVDVMLVLLIVFMVAAPLLTVGVPIDLPQTQAREMNTESKPVTVTVTPDGQVYLLEDAVALLDLCDRFHRNDVDRQRLDIGNLIGARRRQREQAEAEHRRVHEDRCGETGLHGLPIGPVPGA